MTQAEYRSLFAAIGVTGQLLLQFDLEQLLRDMERAEAFGCFADPTLWIDKIGKMREDREVVEAALPLWRMAKKLKERAAADATAAPPPSSGPAY